MFTRPIIEHLVLPAALTAQALNAAKTFDVDMTGWDTLVLQCDYTRNSGTALVFTFAAKKGVSGSGNAYTKLGTNPTSGALSAGGYTFTTSASSNFEVPFRIHAYDYPPVASSGLITVTVTCTGGAAGDLITVTPIVARVPFTGYLLGG